ncbi:A24 family peptidase [Sedimentibacter sp. B4]|uniref:prepilin peptidase n=1 Tax=Sedimentibacter sp. B4 TaxID=304766 RepID=UPI0002F79297|nr:A24 family peptidase [Sedimentibacter sp. B4]
MNIILKFICGVIGGFLGYNIPYFSVRIMEYKKGKININSGKVLIGPTLSKVCFALFNAAAWLLCINNVDNGIAAVLISIQITLGLIIAFIDMNIRIIPNELVLTVLILGIVFQTELNGIRGIIVSVISMIFIMIIFTAVAVIMGLGKVGAGDVKLAGAIGFALGYPLVVTAMATMSAILILFIILGLVFRKIKMSTMLPLAPFLVAGYITALISSTF